MINNCSADAMAARPAGCIARRGFNLAVAAAPGGAALMW